MIRVEVCSEQASGSYWSKTEADESLADRILSGNIKIHSFDTWDTSFPICWSNLAESSPNWKMQMCSLRWVDPLRRTAAETSANRQVYVTQWWSIVRSWIDQEGTKIEDASWVGLSRSSRLIELVLGYPLVPDAEKDRYVRWLRAEADDSIKMRGRLEKASNRRVVFELTGSYVAAAFLDDAELLTDVLELIRQIGMSTFALNGKANTGVPVQDEETYRAWGELLDRVDVSTGITQARLCEVSDLRQTQHARLLHGVTPTGEFESLGDFRPSRIESDGTPENLYVKTKGRQGTPPEDRSAVVGNSTAFGRSGWGEYEKAFSEETFYSLRVGASESPRAHQDTGSITIQNDQKWIVDPGAVSGAASDENVRRFLRTRAAHNVVATSGRSYDSSSKPKMRSSIQQDNADFYVVDDFGYEGFLVSRYFLYLRNVDAFVVRDQVTKLDASLVFPSFRQVWHLHPDAEAEISSSYVELKKSSSFATISWADRARVVVSEGDQNAFYQGWFADRADQVVKAKVLTAASTRRGQVDWLCSISVGDQVVEPISWLPADNGSGGYRVRIRIDGTDHTVEISNSSVQLANARDADGVDGRTHFDIPSEINTEGPPHLKDVNFEDLALEVRKHLESNEFGTAEVRRMYYLLAAEVSTRGNPECDFGARALVSDLAAASGIGSRRHSRILGQTRLPLPLAAGESLISRVGGYHARCISAADDTESNLHADRRKVFVVPTGGLSLSYRFEPGDTKKPLLVFFRGALRRERATLPTFAGIGIGKQLEMPTMVFADPTLDLNSTMTLGWYVGSKHEDMHSRIANEIVAVAKKIGCERVVLTGSSGGGFAALKVASKISSLPVVVLPINPQTDVEKYIPFVARRLVNTVFSKSLTHLDDVERSRISVVNSIHEFKSNVKIKYLQNESDAFHRENHLAPFLNEFEIIRPGSVLDVEILNFGLGHAAPSSEEIVRHIKRII